MHAITANDVATRTACHTELRQSRSATEEMVCTDSATTTRAPRARNHRLVRRCVAIQRKQSQPSDDPAAKRASTTAIRNKPTIAHTTSPTTSPRMMPVNPPTTNATSRVNSLHAGDTAPYCLIRRRYDERHAREYVRLRLGRQPASVTANQQRSRLGRSVRAGGDALVSPEGDPFPSRWLFWATATAAGSGRHRNASSSACNSDLLPRVSEGARIDRLSCSTRSRRILRSTGGRRRWVISSRT